MADKPPAPPPVWLMKLFVAVHVDLYRWSSGAIGGRFGKGPVALLSVRGRKSGKLITLPLVYVTTDKGYAVIASRGGAPQHPAWYLNLKAADAAILTIGRNKVRVRVEEPPIGGERYQSIWRDAVAIHPAYDDYKARTSRPIPVVELEPMAG